MNEITGWLVLLGLALAGFLIWKLAKDKPEQASEESDGDEEGAPETARPAPTPPPSPASRTVVVREVSTSRSSSGGVGEKIGSGLLRFLGILIVLGFVGYLVYLFVTWSVVQDLWKTARTHPTGITVRQPSRPIVPSARYVAPTAPPRCSQRERDVSVPADGGWSRWVPVRDGCYARSNPTPDSGLFRLQCRNLDGEIVDWTRDSCSELTAFRFQVTKPQLDTNHESHTVYVWFVPYELAI